jgi:hypothetical protein
MTKWWGQLTYHLHRNRKMGGMKMRAEMGGCWRCGRLRSSHYPKLALNATVESFGSVKRVRD